MDNQAPPRSPESAAARFASGDASLKELLQALRDGAEPVATLDLAPLALRGHPLGPEGAALVARVLERNRSVTRLVLADHAIGDDGARALADMLCVNRTLAALDLYGNAVTDAGCTALAQALYGHEALQELLLWGNAIGDDGACALAQALGSNRSVTRLGLVGNRIGERGARALLDAVQQNPTIQTVNLAQNDVSSELIHELGAALAVNKLAALKMKSDAVAVAVESEGGTVTQAESGNQAEEPRIGDNGPSNNDNNYLSDDSDSTDSGREGDAEDQASDDALWI